MTTQVLSFGSTMTIAADATDPGTLYVTFRPRPRCEGLTRRGTRCKMKACTVLVRWGNGVREGQRSACKMHQNTWRWW